VFGSRSQQRFQHTSEAASCITMAENTEEVPQLALEAVIGFNGKVHEL